MKEKYPEDTPTEVVLPRKYAPTCVHDVIRLGSKFDGGYAICKTSIQNSDFLLSLGMSEDWRFEEDFLDLKYVPTHLYDHTVTRYWLIKNAIKNFVKALLHQYPKENLLLSLRALVKYRGFVSQEGVNHYIEKIVKIKMRSNETSLTDAIERTRSSRLFLKIDIEGNEYRILDQILESTEKFSGIAIEFHDLDLFEKQFEEFMEKILVDFRINAININNFGLVPNLGFPPVIEISLSKCEKCKNTNMEKIELISCIPNNPTGPNYLIRFEE